MERAYWATTNIGPYVQGQVVVFEETDGWVSTGWFKQIEAPPAPVTEALLARLSTTPGGPLPEQLTRRGRRRT